MHRSTDKLSSLQILEFDDLSPHLTEHYRRILKETIERDVELKQFISDEYLQRTKVGTQHWVDAASKGLLPWGVFVMQKP